MDKEQWMDGLPVKIDNKAEIKDEIRGKRKRKEDMRTVDYETARCKLEIKFCYSSLYGCTNYPQRTRFKGNLRLKKSGNLFAVIL